MNQWPAITLPERKLLFQREKDKKVTIHHQNTQQGQIQSPELLNFTLCDTTAGHIHCTCLLHRLQTYSITVYLYMYHVWWYIDCHCFLWSHICTLRLASSPIIFTVYDTTAGHTQVLVCVHYLNSAQCMMLPLTSPSLVSRVGITREKIVLMSLSVSLHWKSIHNMNNHF